MKMKASLYLSRSSELVEKGHSEGVAAYALKDLKKKDAKALSFIQQAIDNPVFSSQILAATKEGESVHDCSNNLMFIVNQMRKYVEKIIDQTVVEKLLRSLAIKYESTIATIEESKDLRVMTIDELLGSLQSHEDRHKSYEENTIENAFQAKLKFTRETNIGH
ncbi:UNVERIFIED_CONTAM: hypothetical protein Slati_0177200 [Sesamum latifolium]|uniref:UBN2 domain-containing protein n=1 Tax=Sesamum latifolium TaxID=2727402 RepID=A0AAW2YAG7_9LAMI